MEERYCTIKESIIESCKEVKLMREGKKEKNSWKQFVEELNKEINNISQN